MHIIHSHFPSRKLMKICSFVGCVSRKRADTNLMCWGKCVMLHLDRSCELRPLPHHRHFPWLVEQPCRLPHKQHCEGRRDDVSKNYAIGTTGGFPLETYEIRWWPPPGPPRPSSPALSHPLSHESPCLVVVNDEEHPAARVVALARLGVKWL